jgi:hypothetical protein
MKDYFAILGIQRDSDETDIRKAFRRLAKQYHPDLNKSKNAQEKFIEITEAYEFLIIHGQRYKEELDEATVREQDNTDFRASEEFDRFRKEAREKARQQAKMRYEAFKKQNEAFQNSGINDIALLFKIFIRIIIIPVFFFLLLIPVQIALTEEWKMIFLFFLTWPFAGIIAWFIYDNRKQYFMPGKFYYSPERIRQIYTETSPANQRCYYCKSETADSRPYRLDLLKLKDLKINTAGFRQHSVNYVNESATVMVPRSRKAFITHSVITVIKILSILSCLVFLNISSLVWRTITGMVTGGLISSLILLITRTKSNISYLFSYGTVFRIFTWVFLIVMISQFRLDPFNITTSGYIYFVIIAIILFDSFLMQIINYAFGKYASQPVIRQYEEANKKFKIGFRVYNDVPVISVIYPLFKWIFG